MIQISDIRNVAVDGSPVGAFVNAFQESKDPVACQIELERYFDALIESHATAIKETQVSHAAALTTAQDAMQAQVDKAIEDERARSAQAVLDLQNNLARILNGSASVLSEHPDALTAVAPFLQEAAAYTREAQIAAAQAEVEAAKAKLEALK